MCTSQSRPSLRALLSALDLHSHIYKNYVYQSVTTVATCSALRSGPAQSYIQELCAPVSHDRGYVLCSPLWTCTVIYTRTVCTSQSQPSLHALLSTLQPVVTSSFHAPGANSATGHSPLLVPLRGTVCLRTSKLHRHHLHLRICSKHICFPCPAICSNC